MTGVPRRSLVLGVITAIALVLGACGSSDRTSGPTTPDSRRPADISSAEAGYVGTLLDNTPRPALRLDSVTGQRYDLQARPAQEATVLLFGYTNCPDVCPTTMADLAVAYRQLPLVVRRNVSVVFVTEDPRRDTPAVLRRWIEGFDPAFIGLLGGGVRTRSVLKELHVPATEIYRHPEGGVRHPPGHRPQQDRTHGKANGDTQYEVGHSGVVYVFGPGDQTLIYTGGENSDDYASDLTRLVE